ncbi:carboxymuconolactone decarboxylase family protein [Nocardia altamirensis]|uniref:carboxymuconolactone decarboxylase family protein n=1 Tax=Nocardia altamirensis TaxID=472158 RepID=UPI0014354CDE|nr:carboxymuconolactone decarboxylase family protein [Nocardia altamirensis]
MTNPFYLLAEATEIPAVLQRVVYDAGIAKTTLALAAMRASQINGGAACLYAEVAMARTAGASEDQIATVATWRHSPFFDDAERAALALADAATRPATDGGLSDEQWEDLARHFNEKQCAALVLWLGGSAMFNVVNRVIEEPAGTTWD